MEVSYINLVKASREREIKSDFINGFSQYNLISAGQQNNSITRSIIEIRPTVISAITLSIYYQIHPNILFNVIRKPKKSSLDNKERDFN